MVGIRANVVGMTFYLYLGKKIYHILIRNTSSEVILFDIRTLRESVCLQLVNNLKPLMLEKRNISLQQR